MKIKLFKIISIVNFLFISGIFLQAQSEELTSCKGVLGSGISKPVDISKPILDPVPLKQALNTLQGIKDDNYHIWERENGNITKVKWDNWLRSLIQNLAIGEQDLLSTRTKLEVNTFEQVLRVLHVIEAIDPSFLQHHLHLDLVLRKLDLFLRELEQWASSGEEKRTEKIINQIQQIKDMASVEEWFRTSSYSQLYSFESLLKILEALRALDLPIKEANSWGQWIKKFEELLLQKRIGLKQLDLLLQKRTNGLEQLLLLLQKDREKQQPLLIINNLIRSIEIKESHIRLFTFEKENFENLLSILLLMKEIDPFFIQKTNGVVEGIITQLASFVSEKRMEYSPKVLLDYLMQNDMVIGLIGSIGLRQQERIDLDEGTAKYFAEVVYQAFMGRDFNNPTLDQGFIKRFRDNFYRHFISSDPSLMKVFSSEKEIRNGGLEVLYEVEKLSKGREGLSKARAGMIRTLHMLSVLNPINIEKVMEILKIKNERSRQGLYSLINSSPRVWREMAREWVELLLYVSFHSNRQELIEISNELKDVHPELFKILDSDFQEIVGNIVSMRRTSPFSYEPVSHEIVKIVEESVGILNFSLPKNWSETQQVFPKGKQ